MGKLTALQPVSDTRCIVLASASPRRTQLLKQLGIDHRCLAVDIDESHRPPESVRQYVMRLAAAKALQARRQLEDRCIPVLAADTAVELAGEIVGKPACRADAKRMLVQLAGKTHQVFTGVALLVGEEPEVRVDCSSVKLSAMTDEAIEDYLDTGEYSDKAGAYAIQGLAAAFIERLEGSYSAVMGLPLFVVAQLLERNGLPGKR